MQAIRDKAVQDYRKKLLEHREVESRLKEMRDSLKDLRKQHNKSENDQEALQSIGQIVREVLKLLLYNMSYEDPGDITYNVISGLSEKIRELKEVIELTLLNLELFQRVGITLPKGCLLCDPPRTGKTLLARAVVSQLDANFLKVVSSAVVDKYIGEDEVDNSEYRYEIARLQSFKNWPVPHIIEPKRLAAAGFHYVGEGDKVKCFECHVEICQWVKGDNPMVDHQRWSARCRFIRKINCGNIPIGEDPNTVLPPRPRSRNVCDPYGVEYRPTSGPDNRNFTSELRLPSTAKLSCLDLGRTKGPVHPEYTSHYARLQTFEKWPKNMAQTKGELADAGFYFTGKNDETLCYYCGGGLKDWELEDDPWEQHAKWFSKCYYLLMVKGQDYVHKVTGQHIPPPSKEELMQMNLPSFIKKVQPVLMSVDMKEDAESNPGPSSQSSSVDSGIESIRSVTESVKGSIEDLCNTNTQNNKPIDDARMCKICYNEELGVLFSPCGHLVACVRCAPAMTICAVCREPVTEKVRAFFS